mmetsp:Transcript_14919/g.31576  ORF Transcript_14919/g.31576 Transcript_14919/m.31576 type:complete len:264 (+) Transcript_14919:597-1388(+)
MLPPPPPRRLRRRTDPPPLPIGGISRRMALAMERRGGGPSRPSVVFAGGCDGDVQHVRRGVWFRVLRGARLRLRGRWGRGGGRGDESAVESMLPRSSDVSLRLVFVVSGNERRFFHGRCRRQLFVAGECRSLRRRRNRFVLGRFLVGGAQIVQIQRVGEVGRVAHGRWEGGAGRGDEEGALGRRSRRGTKRRRGKRTHPGRQRIFPQHHLPTGRSRFLLDVLRSPRLRLLRRRIGMRRRRLHFLLVDVPLRTGRAHRLLVAGG